MAYNCKENTLDKRYWLFCINFNSAGGLNDISLTFNNFSELSEHFNTFYVDLFGEDWMTQSFYILDSYTNKTVDISLKRENDGKLYFRYIDTHHNVDNEKMQNIAINKILNILET